MRALALLLAAAFVAGCAGRDAPAAIEAVQQLAGPSAEELARTAGTLQGIVHDVALSPIGGAHVEEPRLGVNVTTDGTGFFVLPGLVTGDHMLIVSAPGFATRAITVAARNGTTLEVNISLAAAPVLVPYAETRELNGFIACSALVAGEAHDCASADPNHRDIFEFELGDEGKSVVVELVWDAAASPAGPRMSLLVETVGFGAQDLDLGTDIGEGYARIVVPTPVMEKYYPEGGLMRARVALADDDAPVAATFQTTFTVYVTAFYHAAGDQAFSVVRSA